MVLPTSEVLTSRIIGALTVTVSSVVASPAGAAAVSVPRSTVALEATDRVTVRLMPLDSTL